MQGTGEKAWLAQGKITCPDVAAMWGSKIGDAEFRLLDHPNWPSSSADFPSKKEAMKRISLRYVCAEPILVK
jgi:hypothetical protein